GPIRLIRLNPYNQLRLYTIPLSELRTVTTLQHFSCLFPSRIDFLCFSAPLIKAILTQKIGHGVFYI
ncbi:MAG: hypothetical protein KBG91_07495, partial [Syntrophomonadaceae bacterium]|nr:hypothetical protein [Syntrophomonadaceae bacterium]